MWDEDVDVFSFNFFQINIASYKVTKIPIYMKGLEKVKMP